MNGFIRLFLKRHLYLTLATVCKSGKPWSTPLFFASDGEVIYWWSPKKAVHSQNVERTGDAFITIFDSHDEEGKGKAIYLDCAATEITDPTEAAEAIKIYNQRAEVFQLTEDLTSGLAPSRLYRAVVRHAWTNADREDNGYYIDIRESIDTISSPERSAK